MARPRERRYLNPEPAPRGDIWDAFNSVYEDYMDRTQSEQCRRLENLHTLPALEDINDIFIGAFN